MTLDDMIDECLQQPSLACGEELDRMIEHWGLAPRNIGDDGQPGPLLSDDALRKRLVHFLTKLP